MKSISESREWVKLKKREGKDLELEGYSYKLLIQNDFSEHLIPAAG